MRKEVIFAVIFGIILGGIILFGINLANNSVKNGIEATPSAQSNQPTATPTPETKSTFDVIVPQDHSVLSETTTTLRGTAEPLSTVAIITELNDLMIDVSSEGTFSAQINLSSGANNIKVVQVGKDKKYLSIKLTVIQSDTIPE